MAEGLGAANLQTKTIEAFFSSPTKWIMGIVPA